MLNNQNNAELPIVLVVDDSPDNLMLMSNLLRDKYRVRLAKSGEKALSLAWSEETPVLILLDIVMPEMDGYEVCRRLKADVRTQDIPVIFLTSISSVEGEVQGFELGAVDYITKPFIAPLALARINTHILLAQTTKSLAAANGQLQRERDMASSILERMRVAPHFDHSGIRLLQSPVELSSGDIVLSAEIPQGRQWVLLGDMTGHGLLAAMPCPLVSHIFYQAALEGKPGNLLLQELNSVLCQQLPINIYMATVLLEYHGEGLVTLWNAGLPAVALRRHDGQIEHFASSGVPLGILASGDVFPDAMSLTLQAGDRLYLYTDGITETCAPDGAPLDVEGLARILSGFAPDAQPLEDISREIAHFAQGGSALDDMTLVEFAAH